MTLTLENAERMTITRGEDNLTPKETLTFYSGKCPDCKSLLFKGPTGGEAQNIICPKPEGGCGMKFWEGGPWRPHRLRSVQADSHRERTRG